jgi:ornithine decarboxylase
MMATLAAMGCGFDCASPDEIEKVLSLGVSPANSIIYAHPIKRPNELRFAASRNVNLATYDCEAELDKIVAYHSSMNMVLRIRSDDPNARCQLGNKYGAEPHMWQRLLLAAKDRGLNVVGVSFHVGSGSSNPQAYSRAISAARRVFDMGAELGFTMTLLDIGGGFCARVDEATGLIDMTHVGKEVNLALDEHFPEGCGVEIIAEPGRYFSELAGTFVTQVIGKRPVYEPHCPTTTTTTTEGCGGAGEPGTLLKQVGIQYFLTDGLYGSFNGIVYDHFEPRKIRVLPSRRPDGSYSVGPDTPSTLFGPTCDGLDTIVREFPLPEIEMGDFVAFPNMGAYSLAGATDFNGIQVTRPNKFYTFSLSA